MHIAIVRTEFVKSRGGAERYAVNLARVWLGQGHRISVICTRHDATDAEGMSIVTVPRPKVLGPFKHAWFAKKAGMAAKGTGADVVLCLARAYPGDVLRLGDGLHSMQMEARYGEAGAKRRARLNPRHRELLKLERELFREGRFTRYVANSEMIRDEVIRRYGVAEGRIVVIPNGVDTDVFNLRAREHRDSVRDSHGIPREAKLVLFSGMDFRRKGLMEAVEGFVRLKRDDAWFACVGPGYTVKAEARLAEAGKRARAVFVDHTEDIAQWYGAADVFVLPTSHDPSANAITESLACGTPVITSAQNGAKQHLGSEICGLVLDDRGDADGLGAEIERVLDQPADPHATAEDARLITQNENAARLLETLTAAL